MKVKRAIVVAARTSGMLRTQKLISNTAKMNDQIEKNISFNEQKIAQGIKRAQVMQIN